MNLFFNFPGKTADSQGAWRKRKSDFRDFVGLRIINNLCHILLRSIHCKSHDKTNSQVIVRQESSTMII